MGTPDGVGAVPRNRVEWVIEKGLFALVIVMGLTWGVARAIWRRLRPETEQEPT